MSFARMATLRISDQSYDLMYFRYGFGRKTDWHGRPWGGIQGGDIVLVMESTKSTELLERFLNTDPEYPTSHPPRAISGSIEVCDPEDGMVIRKLVFEEAFIYAVGERMHTDSPLPMMQTIAISPLRLDINRTIRMDRRWPQTYAFWWERFKEPENIAVMGKEVEPTYHIKDAYWIDENGNEIRNLNVKKPVTLYVIMDEYTTGLEANLKFVAEVEDGVKTVEYTENIDSRGIVTIHNFTLEPQKKEEHTNG